MGMGQARSVTSISPALPLAGVEVAMFGRQGDLRGPRGNYRGSKGDLGVISKGSEGIWRELEGSGGTGGIQRDPAGSSGIRRDLEDHDDTAALAALCKGLLEPA